MKRSIIRLKPVMLLISLSIALAISSTGKAQVVDSATTSPTTRSAGCDSSIAAALECLDKSLDAYEKAIAVIGAKDAEIAARIRLDNLKDELLAVKDQYIKDVLADNEFLRKERSGTKSRLRKFFDTVQKVLILAAGVYIGKGL